MKITCGLCETDQPVAEHPVAFPISPANPSGRTSGSQTLHASRNRPSLQSVDRSWSSAITLEERCRARAWLALQQLQPYCLTTQTHNKQAMKLMTRLLPAVKNLGSLTGRPAQQLYQRYPTILPLQGGGLVYLLGQLHFVGVHSHLLTER